MHEQNIAKDIVEKAKQYGSVKSISVEVGDLAHITKDELEAALGGMVNWTLIFTNKEALVKCSCGYKGKPKIVEKRHGLILFVCPECSSLPKVLEGQDIVLKNVEVE